MTRETDLVEAVRAWRDDLHAFAAREVHHRGSGADAVERSEQAVLDRLSAYDAHAAGTGGEVIRMRLHRDPVGHSGKTWVHGSQEHPDERFVGTLPVLGYITFRLPPPPPPPEIAGEVSQ